MNRINQMIDVDRWCIDFCERMGAPHLPSVKDLDFDIAMRDAIRFRGVKKRTADREYIEHKYKEQKDVHLRFWMPMLEVEE